MVIVGSLFLFVCWFVGVYVFTPMIGTILMPRFVISTFVWPGGVVTVKLHTCVLSQLRRVQASHCRRDNNMGQTKVGVG